MWRECRGQLRSSRSEEHTSELQSPCNLVCRLLLEKKDIFAHTALLSATVFEEAKERTRPNRNGTDGVVIGCSFGVIPYVRGQSLSLSFFFNDTATTEIYTLSLHDALPICVEPMEGTKIAGSTAIVRVVVA